LALPGFPRELPAVYDGLKPIPGQPVGPAGWRQWRPFYDKSLQILLPNAFATNFPIDRLAFGGNILHYSLGQSGQLVEGVSAFNGPRIAPRRRDGVKPERGGGFPRSTILHSPLQSLLDHAKNRPSQSRVRFL
jgi:hypothetical protein